MEISNALNSCLLKKFQVTYNNHRNCMVSGYCFTYIKRNGLIYFFSQPGKEAIHRLSTFE